MKKFSAVRARLKDGDVQTHVGEHETITVNIPHKNEMRKLADKIGRVRHTIREKVANEPEQQEAERGPAGHDEQASVFGRLQIRARSLFAQIRSETASPTEGKSNSFYGHKGLNLHEVKGAASHFKVHGTAKIAHTDVAKTLKSNGYAHTSTAKFPEGEAHEFHNKKTGDRVFTSSNSAGHITSAHHRYKLRGTGHGNVGAHAKSPLEVGTHVHAAWTSGEGANGYHYPATYAGQNKDGTHRVVWHDPEWAAHGEYHAHQLHPNSVHKHHPEENNG